MQVTDIPDDFMSNHPSSSVIFDPGGMFDIRNSAGTSLGALSAGHADRPAIAAAVQERLRGYKLPQNMKIGLSTVKEEIKVTNSPLSLVDICGFSTDPVRIGEMPDTKKVF